VADLHEPIGKLAGAAASSAVAAQDAIARGATHEAALLAAGAPFLATAVEHAVGYIAQRFERRGARWFAEYVKAYRRMSRCEADRELREHVERESCKEAIFEAFKYLRDALDDSVVESIARLTAEYSRSDRKPDGFFRGLSRVLADLSGDEFLSVRMLFREGLRNVPTGSPTPEEVEFGERPGDGQLILRTGPDGDAQIPLGASITEAKRFFSLLKVNGLAADGLQRIGVGPSYGMVTRQSTLRRILQIIDDPA
jgi:hypothetical protein